MSDARLARPMVPVEVTVVSATYMPTVGGSHAWSAELSCGHRSMIYHQPADPTGERGLCMTCSTWVEP